MNRPWNSLDKIIVQKLCEDESVDLNLIHIQYKISPISILDSIVRISKFGLAKIVDGRAVRSENFLQNLFPLRYEIYQRANHWKDPQD
jgi:hypothetical protein